MGAGRGRGDPTRREVVTRPRGGGRGRPWHHHKHIHGAAGATSWAASWVKAASRPAVDFLHPPPPVTMGGHPPVALNPCVARHRGVTTRVLSHALQQAGRAD
ncbi:unnamed protein product [Lampetra planeri]